MDNCYQPGLMPFEDGLQRLLASIRPVKEAEIVPLMEAVNRVSAQAIEAPFPLPSFDNSAMDGYAVRFADLAEGDVFPVQATVFAGKPMFDALKPHHCMRIMTGAALPEGADTVIMQEHAEAHPRGVRFLEPVAVGANVRRVGEDIAVKSVVIGEGQLLNAAHVALLASVGCDTVEVYRKTRVGLISTGDELKLPGEPLNWGDIYNANGPGLTAMLQRMNVEVVDYGVLPDNREVFLETFMKADLECDFVITSGGVSVGEADYTKEVLEQLGTIDFWKLAIKPGKPFAFGRLPNSYFIGLPGNPVSALVTFHVLASQALRVHQRVGYQPMKALKATLKSDVRKSPGRLDFQRGVWSVDEEGQVVVSGTRLAQGSHILTSFSQANCYIALEAERGDVTSGETVDIWLFDTLMSVV